MDLLDASEMIKRRTPAELVAWVDEQCERLSSSPEAKSYARSGARLPKKFYEEIRPLALFARSEFDDRPGIYVTPSISNDNFDGQVDLPDGRLLVEVTYAKDGYDESLRMEILEREGHVNALAPISVSGRRGSPDRRVSIPSDTVDHEKVISRNLAYVEQRLAWKSNVHYGPWHVLIVVVDDCFAFGSPQDIDALRSLAERVVPKLALDFGSIVFLGESGNVLFKQRGKSAP